MNIFERVREAWSAFRGRDHPGTVREYTGPSSADRAGRNRLAPGNERTLVNSVYNRIALDVADVEIHHAIVDDNEFYKEAIPDSLEDLFNTEANLDQNARAYMIDLVMSMFDEGVVAEVPIVTDIVRYEPPEDEEEMAEPMPMPMPQAMPPAMAQSGMRSRSNRQGRPGDTLAHSVYGSRQNGSLQHDFSARLVPRDRNWDVLDDDLAWMLPNGVIEKPGDGKKLEIEEIRTGKIVEWKPRTVIVECYNERTGNKERFEIGKRRICIHENPFYSVMNEKNSIFQRLVKKLAILDAVDNNLNSDKLNAIVQLPYLVRTDVKREEANKRIRELERQMKESPHGIAWIDGTEKFTPLSKPLDNSLQSQIEWLTTLFFSQLGITQEILNGTADEKTMSNYMNRTVGVVLEAICSERRRKLLTKEQRDHHESIVYVQDPLRLIPATSLADIFDKLSRNAILSPNECRGTLGYKPSEDPSANQLGNRNMPKADTPEFGQEEPQMPEEKQPEESIPRR